MRLWREIRGGLTRLVRAREADRDVSDELRHFMEEAEADLVARGAQPGEARRRARLRYGDPLTALEDVRGSGWEAGVETLIADVRLSVRSLRRSPGFTTVVVLTLGIGIGATTAILSAVRPVLFEPLAYPGAERLVTIADRGVEGVPIQTAFGTWLEVVQRNRSFEGLAVVRPWQPTLAGGDEPMRLEGQRVSASYFDVLRVAPALGRGLDPKQDHPDGVPEVLLGEALWRDRFGADADVLGRTILLDGAPTTVVGVMPPGFENVTAPGVQVWTLLRYDPLAAGFDTREWGRHLDMIGRLRRGLSLDRAVADLDAIAADPLPGMPRPTWASLDGGFVVERLEDAVVADVKPAMLVLLGSVALLVVVTCANLTLVLLARGARRRGEFAMRTALGAARGRLARYLITEGLMLAVLGGALGVVVARLALDTLMTVAPPALPRTGAVGLDGPTLGVTLALTVLVGVVFGLAPGLHRAGTATPAVGEAGRGSVRRSGATHRGLVVAEVALATMLLVGAGLLLRSAERLFAQPLGLRASGVAVMQVFGTGLERGDAATHRFFDEALEALRGVPGVRSVALTSQLPLAGEVDVYGVVPDDPGAVEGARGPAQRYAVTPGYLETMAVPVLRGRPFGAGDVAGSPPVAVVSRSLARRLHPDGDALGERIRVGAGGAEPFTIVGVVEDVKHGSLADGPEEAVYTTAHQWHWADRVRWVVVRSDGDPTDLVPELRRAVWSADPDQPIVRAQSMEALVERSEARRRFVMLILSAFALSAFAVAGVGLFGVLSGMVAERTRELGVRAALGASRERIVRMVVGQGLGLTAVGAAVGMAGAAAATGTLRTLLYGVSRVDPLTYVGVIALLGAGAAVACVVPAIRAGRADPVDALRSE